MSLTGGSKFILTGGATNYQIARSLRFRSSASAYLTRTYSAAPTTKTKCAISLWTKVAGLGAARRFMDCYDGSSGNQTWLGLNSSDQIEFTFGGASPFTRTTTAVFRDPAAHLHIHCVVDTTPVTPTITVSVNGVAQTMTGTLPAQNATHQFTSANANNKVGSIYNGNGGYYEGLLSEFYFIDGIATSLPSDFGQTNATTGAWNPIKYTGTYGTNGFYLPFSDNSAATSTTIGKDSSGNGNNWTPSGISITAGVTNDSLVDTPTNYGSDTGAGGEVRGNYCTLNPLQPSVSSLITLSAGNLQYNFSGSTAATMIGTVALPVDQKIYWEASIDVDANNALYLGAVLAGTPPTQDLTGAGTDTYVARVTLGTKFVNGSSSSLGATPVVGDTLGFAFRLPGFLAGG